jgi:hypothetical protein
LQSPQERQKLRTSPLGHSSLLQSCRQPSLPATLPILEVDEAKEPLQTHTLHHRTRNLSYAPHQGESFFQHQASLPRETWHVHFDFKLSTVT